MSKIAIVYWSGTGNTAAMANLIAEGATEAGVTPEIVTADSFSPEQVGEYDRIAFGCPSMGSEQLEGSVFEPMFESVKPALSGKKIALFGSYGWGDGEWMRNWADDCVAAGCNLVADPLTICGGPEADVEKCKELGEDLVNA